jgi:hypothetical protein
MHPIRPVPLFSRALQTVATLLHLLLGPGVALGAFPFGTDGSRR